jgi:hypothetical protein
MGTPWEDEADCDGCLFIAPDPHEISCTDGYIARGLQVSASDQVYNVALICGPPPTAAKYLGRVHSDTTDTPTPTLCEAAVSARARNSPAAPSLEKQCAEFKAAHPVPD